jgi:hypothetical protein
MAATTTREAPASLETYGLKHVPLFSALASDHHIRTDITDQVLHGQPTWSNSALLTSVHELDPRKLVQVAFGTSDYKPRRYCDRLLSPSTLSVDEPSQIWATRIPVLEAPDLTLFLNRTETLTGYAAQPLREWQDRDTYPRRLAGRIAGLLR